MTTIKEYAKGISVVEIDGAYCVHEIDGTISYNISCGSLEAATRRAQAESWYKLAIEFDKEIHHAYRLTLESFCGKCPYRDTSECLETACPAYNIGNEISKSVRQNDRTVKRMRRISENT